jgi:hypothetical protein
MVWRQPYEPREIATDGLDLPPGLPDECVYVMGSLSDWADMSLWERLVADSGWPVWYGVCADAGMAQAVIPRSRLDRVILVMEMLEEPIAVVVREGVPVYALAGKSTEGALDKVMEKMR